ncbi:MAG: IclR family transcriptional regulator [Bacillota bacterium]
MGVRVAGQSREEDRKYYEIGSLEKAFKLLSMLSSSQGMTLAALCQETRLHRATAYRILLMLEDLGLVRRDTWSGQWQLGIGIFELGAAFAERSPVIRVSRPYLEDLARETGETAQLAVLDRGEAVIVDRVLGGRPIQLAPRVGSRIPAYCTALGKALLAYQSEKVISETLRTIELVPLTPSTITQKDALVAELSAVRRRGFSVDNGESQQFVCCVGAPVLGFDGRCVAALSVARLTNLQRPEEVLRLGRRCVEVAGKISLRLGYRPKSAEPGGEEHCLGTK